MKIKSIFILALMAMLLVPIGVKSSDKYTVIGGTWDINRGQFGGGVDAWQDFGGRFLIGEQGYISDTKSGDDAGGGMAIGPGFWIFNNNRFQVGVLAQGANAFIASQDGETAVKWGGQLVGTASYVLPESMPAYAVTLIVRQSYIGENETNIMLGISFKSD